MIESRALKLPPEIRKEYPFKGETFDLNREGIEAPVKMHYLDEGQGPVVVMLHGNPTWSFYYRNLVNTLTARGFRCVVPDHIGCGLSDKPQEYSYTLSQRIEDIEQLVQHLGIEKFSLVVHDWGGAIGCGVAGRNPDALEKLVILNTAAFRSLRIPFRIASIKVPLIGEAIIRGLNGFAGPAAAMSVCQPLPPAVKAGFLWPYRNWADRVAVWNFVKDIPLREKHRSYPTLAKVEDGLQQLMDKPTLMVWGARDFCFNMHFYERWCEFFPKAKKMLKQDCGHYILEDGGTSVWEVISEFFEKEA